MTSARAFLFSLEQIGIKLGLEQIRALLDLLGRPEQAFRSLVVAGTNGKGSVVAMLERALRAAGYRTGRYTSPHLVDLEERFAVDGQPIVPSVLDAIAARIQQSSAALPHPPSFFEATTALALEAFRDARVDVAVLEVGLGGRLDATNVAPSSAVAITQVDFDHEQYLGHTIEAIAREKAGVIKDGSLVVLAPNATAVEAVVADVCGRHGAQLVRAAERTTMMAVMIDGRARLQLETPRGRYPDLRLSLRGGHQVQNALTAIRLLEELAAGATFTIPIEAVRTGVEDCVWPGRLELVASKAGHLLLDGAHNPAGARALVAYLSTTYGRRLPMVIGVMQDKQIPAILETLAPAASHFVFTAAATGRAASPAELEVLSSKVAPGVPASTAGDPVEAVRQAQQLGSLVVVAGSLYLVGEIRANLA